MIGNRLTSRASMSLVASAEDAHFAGWMRGPLVFEPHPLIPFGHAQTAAGMYLPYPYDRHSAIRHSVFLPDGDALVLHEDVPLGDATVDRCVLLIHGLAGSHASPYVRRVAVKLAKRGIRAFRMDMRGWGAGYATARGWAHAGRSEDIAACIDWILARHPGERLIACGCSLGANMLLKLLGEYGPRIPPGLAGAIAISPPLDLGACVANMGRGVHRLYDRFFARRLWWGYRRRQRLPDVIRVEAPSRPRTLREFDTFLTAPLGGFGSVDEYYTRSSSLPLLPGIQLPTLIVTAEDDPLIPVALFHEARYSPSTRLRLIPHGGHLGYIAWHAEATTDLQGVPMRSDHRWLDWRILEWAEGLNSSPGDAAS